MAKAEQLAFAAAREHIGRTMTVLVDGADESGRLVARHAGQAPEVDSVVLLPPGAAADRPDAPGPNHRGRRVRPDSGSRSEVQSPRSKVSADASVPRPLTLDFSSLDFGLKQ